MRVISAAISFFIIRLSTQVNIMNPFGKIGCPCINTTELSSILINQERCSMDDESSGYKNKKNVCYPNTYGGDGCAKYDKLFDANCDSSTPPEYCEESWCYIDPNACKLSEEYYYITDHFSKDADLFYSYTTCDSSSDPWKYYTSTDDLEGKNLTAVIPTILFPKHYKISHLIHKRGDEYYNESLPWQGWLIDWFDAIVNISNINSVTYTFQSLGSDNKTIAGNYTSSVYDVQAGIVDMGLSPYWVTSERLSLASFVTPIDIDKLYLYMPKPTQDTSNYLENLQKTLDPFELNLWYMVILVFVIVGFLRIVFDNMESSGRYWSKFRDEKWKEANYVLRARIIAQLAFESCLYESAIAMGGTVSVAYENTLALKILYTGFSFFLLILISTYTANLAAFLTIKRAAGISSIQNLDDAIRNDLFICTYSALKAEFERMHPYDRYRYYGSTDELATAFSKNDRTCDAIITSMNELRESVDAMKIFCEQNLQVTGAPVLEKFLSFPVSSEMVGGISYWIYEAERQGILYKERNVKSFPDAPCGGDFGLTPEVDDLGSSKFKIQDFSFPVLVFFICVVLATSSHVFRTVSIPVEYRR